jgi:hypothetical protein
VRFHELLPRQAERSPAQLVVVEPEVASPLRLKNGDEILLVRAAARERRRNEHIEEAVHRRRRGTGLVRERIRAAQGMMKPGRGLEASVVLRAADQEARNV